MKDYTLNREDRKKFIKQYDIRVETNELIIHKANATRKVIPYTRKNEQKILKKMERQAKKGLRHRDKFYRKYQRYLTLTTALVASIGCSFLFNLSNLQLVLTDWVFSFAVSILPFTSYKWYTYKKRKDELDKMAFFLLHKQELNDNVRTQQTITEGISQDTVDRIKKTDPRKPVFDVNNLDQYSLEELKIMRENSRLKQQFAKISQPAEPTMSAKILIFPNSAPNSNKKEK